MRVFLEHHPETALHMRKHGGPSFEFIQLLSALLQYNPLNRPSVDALIRGSAWLNKPELMMPYEEYVEVMNKHFLREKGLLVSSIEEISGFEEKECFIELANQAEESTHI